MVEKVAKVYDREDDDRLVDCKVGCKVERLDAPVLMCRVDRLGLSDRGGEDG